MSKALRASTVKGVEKLLREGVKGEFGAGKGLYLNVSNKSTGSWIFRYRLDGKRKRIGLGSVDAVTLARAGVIATEYRALVAQGIDPQDERQERQDAAVADVVTFDMVAADYIAIHGKNWTNEKHRQQWINTLATYASPIIGHQAPANITHAHMLRILKPIWDEKNETASRVRNRIELVLKLARSRRLFTGENVAAWDGVLEFELGSNKTNNRRHHPALPWSQAGAFWRALESEQDVGATALQLTMLTALRTSEALGAKWSEFDLDAGIWTVPAGRMKTKIEHRVPLSTAALGLLASIPRANSGLLFEGRFKGKTVNSEAMRLKAIAMDAAKYDLDGIGWRDDNGKVITPHGFRSTFRDWAAENTLVDNIVVEQALAHAIGDAVEAAYRRGDLLERRRELMEAWGEYTTRPANSNVVQMHREA